MQWLFIAVIVYPMIGEQTFEMWMPSRDECELMGDYAVARVSVGLPDAEVKWECFRLIEEGTAL